MYFFSDAATNQNVATRFARRSHQKNPVSFLVGPTIDFFPLPVPDPSSTWGSLNCPDCRDSCCGHFLKPDKYLKNIAESSVVMPTPPSHAIKEFVQHLDRPPLALSQSVLLSEQDVKFWIAHLETVSQNRK